MADSQRKPLESPRLILENSQGFDWVHSLSHSPDGRLLLSRHTRGDRWEEGEGVFWDARTGKLSRTLANPLFGHGGGLHFSPEGKAVAVTHCGLSSTGF